MERPTCKTCPYWDRDDEFSDTTDGGRVIQAKCRRHAPGGSSDFFESYEGEAAADDGNVPREWTAYNLARFSTTEWSEWCGEHPDFPAYIASLKEPVTVNGDSA